MSVISETQENSPIIVTSQFVACQYGTEFNWEASREFNIGDSVMYLDSYEDGKVKQEHLKWKIKFQCQDGTIYAASQLYFVTLDNWEEIQKYFSGHSFVSKSSNL
jgi:hypothetical protein